MRSKDTTVGNKAAFTQFFEKEKTVEFVRCKLTDMQGNLREVTVTKEQLSGTGITSVDGSSVFGKIIPPTESDMVLVPDTSTLFMVPWSQDTAQVICDIFFPPKKEGEELEPYAGCSRGALKRAMKGMEKIVKKHYPGKTITKVKALFAPELEFLLLPKEYDIAHIHTDSGLRNDHYFIPPADQANKALKIITQHLGVVGLKREKWHTEVATGQYEIGIGHGKVLRIADGTITAKDIIRTVAGQNGLKASFIPKFNRHVNGSGMHTHMNISAIIDDAEVNLFYDPKKPDGLSELGRKFIAGLLKYAREITSLTNSLPISYKRLVPGAEAPTRISWDWLNRTALCRGHSRGTTKVRVEYRAPDPMCNPYLAFSALLLAGLAGIEENLKLSPPDKRNLYHDNDGVAELPGSLTEALLLTNSSKMLRKGMGDFIIDTLFTLGMEECRVYNQAVTDWDIENYL
ncbi:MAG: glutamine synthetase family protein [Candidatus Staskawiczbacteria bacterium]|nr:glutamine synthetase family protein [Candidatus Staskawiczbacteria bacterium]